MPDFDWSGLLGLTGIFVTTNRGMKMKNTFPVRNVLEWIHILFKEEYI